MVACAGGAGGEPPPARKAVAGPHPAPTVAPVAPVVWRQPGAGPAAALAGLDGAGLTLLLGAPGLKRREPPAEVWRYSGETCTLHLFLYQGPAGIYRVVYAESRAAGTDDCLARLIEERRPQPLAS